MHRKRVTSELHDSYFRLMTIKHSISKIQLAIVWALSYYLTQLSLGPRAVASRIPDSQRPNVVGKATPDRGGPRKSPDGVDPNIRRTRKTQRDGHNSGVKIWCLCSVSSTLSHENLTNKVRGKYNCKEVFLRLPSCILIVFASLMRRLSLRQYLSSIYMYATEGVLRIPQSPSITGTSPSDCLVSYQDTRWGGVLTLSREAVGVFYSLSRLGKLTYA